MAQLERYGDPDDRKDPIAWEGPILASGRLVLVNSEGQLVSVSPLDGTVQSTTDIGEAVYVPMAVADNTLYILSEDGRLSAYR